MNGSYCSIGMEEENLSHRYLRACEVQDCINNEWMRQMQYRHERGQSEPVSTY